MRDRSSLIDWGMVFIDLSARGYSMRMVSIELDIPLATLAGWKNIPGTDPKYTDAKRLIALWCDVTGKQESGLPGVLLA